MIAWLRAALGLIALIAATAVLLPVHLAALALEHPWRMRIPRYWHKVACFALGLRVHVHGRLSEGRPLLLASNHVSWKDIIVLGSVADVVYVAKSEVKTWPIFGTLARLQRSVFIERERRRETGQQIDEVARRLLAGEIVVLFPEGTTSDGNRVLDIKTSLFGAVTAVLPHNGGEAFVQPVALAYTRIHGMPMGRYHRPVAAWPGDVELMPSLLGVLREGAIDVEVSFGTPFRHTDPTERKAMARTVGDEIRTLLGERLRGRPKSGA